jgi:DNA-binding response OmpR family regulator
MVGDPQSAFEAGCDAYISKPIEVRSFAAQVRALIESAASERRDRA